MWQRMQPQLAGQVVAPTFPGSGGLLFGAVFMATDYVTSPFTLKGKLVYGVALGIVTFAIRYWGSYTEGVSFALLFMALTSKLSSKISPMASCSSLAANEKIVAMRRGLLVGPFSASACNVLKVS